MNWIIGTLTISSALGVSLVAQATTTGGILEKLGEQAPALAVLVFLVIVFLRHLRQESQDRQEEAQARRLHYDKQSQEYKEMGLACHAAHRELHNETKDLHRKNQEVIDRNTAAHNENTAATKRMETVLEKLIQKHQ